VPPAAVSDKIGTGILSDGPTSVMNSLLDAKRSKYVIEVKTTTLDHETISRRVPHLTKIDVEGAEIKVLRGAQAFIKKNRPLLLVELHSPEIAIQYGEIIDSLGYATCDLSGDKIDALASGARFVLSQPA